jgi:hypothetical protein
MARECVHGGATEAGKRTVLDVSFWCFLGLGYMHSLRYRTQDRLNN